MSKEIDLDKPLSDEDREWLHEHSLDHQIQANDRQFAEESEEPEVDEDGGQEFVTTGAKAPWEPGQEPVQQFAQRPYDPPMSGNWDPGPVVSEEDVEAQIEAQEAEAEGREPKGKAAAEPDDDLDTWTVEELKDELAARGEPTSGNKADLVKRLRKG
jgi:hypothetical protein